MFIKAKGTGLYLGDQEILLTGFGLNGWFLPEGYMWNFYEKCDRPRRMEQLIKKLCGETYAETFWERFLDFYYTEKDISLVAKNGFNSVRLPLNARTLYECRHGNMEYNKDMFKRIDTLIEWCNKHSIYLVLDMHGAPGGQTGTNIDDSEADYPELFIDQLSYQDELIQLWQYIANRYKDETIIAGFDLLNEPLPEWFSKYNDKVMPLYKKIIKAIREVNKNHMIILEGVHWSTDWSIFESLKEKPLDDNIMLQFHKYWNNPDKESLENYLRMREEIQVPIYMGEGGENNLDWYAGLFPLLEDLNISWNFWSYKKMDCRNSPQTFSVPEGWDKIINYLSQEGEKFVVDQKEAQDIFDNFLTCISKSKINKAVFKALKRESPCKIPAVYYNRYSVIKARQAGANLRQSEDVSIIFVDGHKGDVDFKRYAGEDQPEEERLVVLLHENEWVAYDFKINKAIKSEANLLAKGVGIISIAIDGEVLTDIRLGEDLIKTTIELGLLKQGKHEMRIKVVEGEVGLESIEV